MSGNVHGHQLPKKGINVNPDNPVFARHEPESVPAEIPQGLHGAPALRSELDNAADTSPAAVAQQDEQAPAEAPAAEVQDPIPEHEDAPENLPETAEAETGASDPDHAE